jgi:phospholipid/cholesterol/gamma-HCH transport system ATP-binding protein
MISVQNLGIQFQDTWIFKNASLEVLAKQSVVIIGPSGSGKSVFLKLLAGLLTPTEGEVKLASSNLGMLFQKNALFDSLTVEENLLFPLKERKGIVGAPARELAKKFLKSVELDGNQNLYPDELSGGMQKRLGIARALIVEPEIIFYDEPTAGLDPITSRTIAELIQNLKSTLGSTLITVTNDVQRAYQLADQIYFLAQGQLTRGGAPQEVKDTQNAGLRQFIYGLKQGPLTSGLG